MSIVRSALRSALMVVGALVGSYGGRLAAAKLRGEPVAPLLRVDRSTLLKADIVPGYMAAELVCKALDLGPVNAAAVAMAAGAASAIIEGPFVRGGPDTKREYDGWEPAAAEFRSIPVVSEVGP